MGATYDSAQLGESELYRARFALGDSGFTTEDEALLQDEEIEALIEMYGYAEGVAQCCDALVTRFAQDPDEHEDEGKVRAKWTERIKAWKDLAKRLRAGTVTTSTALVPTGFSAGGAITLPSMTDYR